MTRIYVLNPNSSTDVTDSMEQSAALVAPGLAAELVFGTLDGAPAGIESQADVEAVVHPLVARLEAEPADAHVIGCFSDPGLHLARERLAGPVVGIAEAAYGEALLMGGRFGVVSIVQASIGRHRRAVRALGYESFLAGDRSLDMGVAAMADAERAVARICEVGTALRDRDGAECLVLGCASMGIYRPEIESRLGLPVIDPVQAAVLRGAALVALRYPRFS
ncbi:aspartate/glutamate racemase family protein [Salipiger mucosus]|uniref:Hydantoin racemase n=1 Tax=Salipiger mucosus DSM 16094 TaxID=1123237 RepID=S9QK77_9RHOB|nr:aspartate/glutamate racemase family protein [Salipiger mucosus]EPX81871.1 Hydantoin racemase [Salipiger mucosus DSM 16094]